MKPANTYCFVGVLIGVAIIGVLFGIFAMKKATLELIELKQVHVIFNHGERTPSIEEEILYSSSFENEIDSYYPHGFNSLTNEGKMTMFKVGENLRNLYDDYLTKIYNQEESTMQVIDTDISKMSALLVLAGLWPVETNKIFDNIKWQPIPYRNIPIDKDYMLYNFNCPRYIQEKERKTLIYLKYMPLQYVELFTKISSITGHNITTPAQVTKLIGYLSMQKTLGKKYPLWYRVRKFSLEDIIKLEYDLMFCSKLLQKLSGGPILKEIIFHSKECIEKSKRQENTVKLYMYSGYINNIASVLNIFVGENIILQEHGLTFIMELYYRPTFNDYGFKIFTLTKTGKKNKIVNISGCEELCPFNILEIKLKDIIDVNYIEDCRSNINIHLYFK